MQDYVRWFGLLAVFHAGLAAAQSAPLGQHSEPSKAAAKPATQPVASRAEQARAVGDRSAFATYRPFNADEPVIDWRAANEQVREAGGHLGLMKGGKAEGSSADPHAGHGSVTPPAGRTK